MTVIVADRTGMASDSQMTDGATQASVPKFWRIKRWLVGAAGTYPHIIKVIEELKGSKLDPVKCLADVEMDKVDCDLLMLSPAGMLYMSNDGSLAMPISDGFAAIGSGAQGALVAMHLGTTTKEAVVAVKKVDPSCGGRVITRKL